MPGKNFNKWFASLSTGAQRVFQRNGFKSVLVPCEDNSEKLRFRDAESLDADYAQQSLTQMAKMHYRGFLNRNEFARIALAEYKRRNMRAKLTEDEYYNGLYALYKEAGEIAKCFSFEEFRAIQRIEYKADGLYYARSECLSRIVYLHEGDYKNIDFSSIEEASVIEEMLDASFDGTVELLGYDKIFERAKTVPRTLANRRGVEVEKMRDALVFGENGWSEQECITYFRSEYSASVHGVEKFMADIVSVDKYWLKHLIPLFIDRSRGLASALYKATMPTEDRMDNSVSSRYRYPRDIRRVFLMAGACVNKAMGNAKQKLIGPAATMLRVYNYNFEDIMACLYPDEMMPDAIELDEAE